MLLWASMMKLEWNKKDDLLAEQAFSHIQKYAPVLVEFATTPAIELLLLQKVCIKVIPTLNTINSQSLLLIFPSFLVNVPLTSRHSLQFPSMYFHSSLQTLRHSFPLITSHYPSISVRQDETRHIPRFLVIFGQCLEDGQSLEISVLGRGDLHTPQNLDFFFRLFRDIFDMETPRI